MVHRNERLGCVKSFSSVLFLPFHPISMFAEVTIKPEHMQGETDIKVEPVTLEMAEKVGKPPKVEVTTSRKGG